LADPQTTNIGLVVPLRGSDPGTWDTPVNSDFVALDGFQGGIQPLTLSNAPITLTVPAGFTAAPTGGPTQAQNAVLRLTGAMTGPVTITLPMPGYYIVENLTTGNFVVTLQAVVATQVVGIEQGACQHVYNDGSNVRFVNLGRVGVMEFWTGYTAMPAWVAACTIPPYLLCAATVFNFSTYPYLGARYGSNFGGNGVTTAATPDMQGRVPLAYDGTGTRITSAVSGINGQTIGAAGGDQNSQSHTHTFTGTPGTATSTNTGIVVNGFPIGPGTSGGGASPVGGSIISSLLSLFTPAGANSTFGAGASQNVPPAQVAGIWVVKAA
jgi:microcystin-dependent protein